MNPGATASIRATAGRRTPRARRGAARPRQVCGTHWVNIAHDVLAVRGASVGSNTLGMQTSANGSVAGLPGRRLLERGLDVVQRLGQHDRAAVHLRVELRVAGERRQPVDRKVDLHRAGAGLPRLDVGDEVGRQLGAVDQLAGTRSAGAPS